MDSSRSLVRAEVSLMMLHSLRQDDAEWEAAVAAFAREALCGASFSPVIRPRIETRINRAFQWLAFHPAPVLPYAFRIRLSRLFIGVRPWSWFHDMPSASTGGFAGVGRRKED